MAFDVAIIGGGFGGVALAYHLACAGASVIVLEARGLLGGASAACAGRAQVAESHLAAPYLELVLAGWCELEGLEEALGAAFAWRRGGHLTLIERPEQWSTWQARVMALQAAGVPAEMLDARRLAEIEPHLDARPFLGAAWCLEGQVNPFRFGLAYMAAAARLGAQFARYAPAIGCTRRGARITEVVTPHARYAAGRVVAAAGVWSGGVLQMLGAGEALPVRFTHAEALITEPLPPVLQNHIGMADFYETLHHRPRAVVMGVGQQSGGALLASNAVEKAAEAHSRSKPWALPGLGRGFQQLFPGLAGARTVRSWAAASPYLPDERPAIGWAAGLENVFVAACFHLAVTTIPAISKLAAGMILGGPTPAALAPYTPARFSSGRINGETEDANHEI